MKIGVIGSGFSGLAASAILAINGMEVDVYEKNSSVGGRARVFKENGFLFDMGPSWYWMPDVFENFYNIFGHATSDFYNLKKLDPGFQIIFGKNDTMPVPAGYAELQEMFENLEKGAAKKLDLFMAEAEFKYNKGINDLVYKPGLSVSEFFDLKLIRDAIRLQIFASFSKHVRQFFNHPRLIALLEFPILFLGAMPENTPALYSLMNFAGLKQGTWYPMGGFGEVINAFKDIAEQSGAHIHTNVNIESFDIKSGLVTGLISDNKRIPVDAVIGAGDYHHIESTLLPEAYRNYSPEYWDKRIFAPSCLIFYIGVNKKIKNLIHHNLFFDADFGEHAIEIYKDKKWPTNPLFYVCCPSKTDNLVAPVGQENLFILMPIAPGLSDTDASREQYYDLIMERIESFTGQTIRQEVIYKRSYCVSDFVKDYNAYKGNAYGLANTLFQTAIFKPKMRSRKVKNLFYAGQLTVPGPGVPPCIVSGQVAAHQLLKSIKKTGHETNI